MRLRNIPWAKEAIERDTRCICSQSEAASGWHTIFGSNSPIRLEIGMGKGRFIIEMAKRHPNINFIGVERYESVMIKALKKLDTSEELPNLRFLRADAENIDEFFDKNSVDKIYLNFSDPWPKNRHAKRRLESKGFLEKFHKILIDGGSIEFKTDNQELFDFALGEIDYEMWTLTYCSRDLHSDAIAMEDNVMTEYEEKFSSRGNKIFKYVILGNRNPKGLPVGAVRVRV